MPFILVKVYLANRIQLYLRPLRQRLPKRGVSTVFD